MFRTEAHRLDDPSALAAHEANSAIITIAMPIAYTPWELETRDAAVGLPAQDHRRPDRVWSGLAHGVELSGPSGGAELVFTLETDATAQFRFALDDETGSDLCRHWTPDEFATVAIANATSRAAVASYGP
jgi:hypothetical protein